MALVPIALPMPMPMPGAGRGAEVTVLLWDIKRQDWRKIGELGGLCELRRGGWGWGLPRALTRYFPEGGVYIIIRVRRSGKQTPDRGRRRKARVFFFLEICGAARTCRWSMRCPTRRQTDKTDQGVVCCIAIVPCYPVDCWKHSSQGSRISVRQQAVTRHGWNGTTNNRQKSMDI